MKLAQTLGLAAAGAAAAAALAALVFADALYLASVEPRGRLAREATPQPPDYAAASSWALRPEARPAGAWETPWGVDVFFVHPTTAFAARWNAAADQPAAARRLADETLPTWAEPFRAAGPIYAPRYRQAGLHADRAVAGSRPRPDARGAYDLAYSDVLRAFDRYMAEDNQGRGVMLAGVGQGGRHVLRLLSDRFADPAAQRRLAAAYVIDAAAPADGAPVPLCREAADLHCLAAWTTAIGSATDAKRTADGRALACLNPVSWNAGEALSPRSAHRGGARADAAGSPDIYAQAVTAQCVGGVLAVSRPAKPRLKEREGWGAGVKPARVNLFYSDVALNAGERSRALSAWLDDNEPKPARPLPPVAPLPDAPIFREDGIVDYVEP